MKLFESMLWQPQQGIFLQDLHTDRLASSAAFLGYPFALDGYKAALDALLQELEDLEKVEATMSTAPGTLNPGFEPGIGPVDVPDFSGRGKKLRIFLDAAGNFSTDYEDLELRALPYPLRLGLADVHLDSGNPLIRHKTTRRDIYTTARSCSGRPADDLLFLNERNELCESTRANLVIKRDGCFLTPPLSCGLLPGTFRRYLLEKGDIREEVIFLPELSEAQGLFLINSVRGWMPAVFDD